MTEAKPLQKLETDAEQTARIMQETQENEKVNHYKEEYIAQGMAKEEEATDDKIEEEKLFYTPISGNGNLEPDAEIYKQIGEKYGIDWRMISAIHCTETFDIGASSCSRHTNSPISTAGARGCMQFMPKTWTGWTASSTGYGVDGSGDGVADINNCRDSLYSAGNYLSASYKKGLSLGKNEEQARWYAYRQYNHADWYANRAENIFNTLK